MRLFLGGLIHETNSFSPLPTSRQSFEEGVLIRGSEPQALARLREQAVLGGVFEAAKRQGDTLLPGLFAQAEPAGPLPRADYERLRDELLADLQAAMPVDAVLLVLHGAMLAEGYPDCEGDLLQRVRALVGEQVPVGALLDLHCNLSPAMVDSGAVLIACKEYPHTDYAPRGVELHGLLSRMARGELKALRAQWRRVPMTGIFGTTESPMREFVQRLQDSERCAGLLTVSALHGFPWSDTEHTGAALLAYAEQDVVAIVQALAEEFYALRQRASSPRLPMDEAINAALAAPPGLVVLADSADNPGGGAACDSSFILRALLQRGVRDAALGMIWDPQAVAIATAAGVGARLALRVGGKVGPMSGDPLDLEVEVLACRSDATQRGLVPGSRDPLGAAVALRVQGVDLVLNSLRQQVFSPDCFSELGIALQAKRLVVVKSTQHFRAGFDPLAVASFYADTPGSLRVDLTGLPYRHLRRPLWPLDQDGR
ncbi:M81 family metallopeptidase [Roseateles violae]|uniref:Microcystinase C n=1 Tax=Roseateles violae TaxID=3058042 RepID=A0ABT8DMH5_9BURK|nr:M81 family metallopeptidase [Pelomonas sp. PFR6]MDN3919128.1 M81 family metallopeptidase [Pelomonas sp. PFR6]